MAVLLYLVPIALFLGLLALAAFIWSLRSGQYEDLDGAAQRILFDDDDGPGDGSPADPGDGSPADPGDGGGGGGDG